MGTSPGRKELRAASTGVVNARTVGWAGIGSLPTAHPRRLDRSARATTLAGVVDSMRIALVSFGVEEFSALHAICTKSGHLPVVYAYSRAMRPRARSDPYAATMAREIIEALPPGMDFLLPGSAEGLAEALAGYRLDLIVVYGFSWKLPESVLRLPRFGAINVHSSLLPRYRGPAPVLWAIRNGDEEIGLTVHRMDENFDTGPILAQRGGIRLDDDITPERLWRRTRPVLEELVKVALDRVARGDPGEPQGDAGASHAGLLEPEFSRIDWSRTSHEIHNQVRTLRFTGPGNGPIARVEGRWIKVLRTRLEQSDGIRVDCADGPIWIVESQSAEPPASGAPDAQ
jgi:methionyl-tRNA formyltransferase